MRRMLLALVVVVLATGLGAAPVSARTGVTPGEDHCSGNLTPWPPDDAGCDPYWTAPDTNLPPQVVEVGKPYRFRPTWNGEYDHLVWRFPILPESGLTIDSATGEISGTLRPGYMADLDYVKVSAVASNGKTVRNLVFRMLLAEPHIYAEDEDEDETGQQAREGTKLTSQLRGLMFGRPTFTWSRGPRVDGPFTPIEGATAYVYTPTAADVGSYVRVDWTIPDDLQIGDLHLGLTTSHPVGPKVPIGGLAPTVNGPRTTDGVLHLDPGDLPAGVDLSCTWYADDVQRRTGCEDYPVSPADAGRQFRVVVAASGPGYLSRSKASARTSSIVSTKHDRHRIVVNGRLHQGRELILRAPFFTEGTRFRVYLAGRRIATGTVGAQGDPDDARPVTRVPRSVGLGDHVLRVSGFGRDGVRYWTTTRLLRVYR